MSKHGETERKIISKFEEQSEFTFKNIIYEILEIGKPKPSKGECKTDVYILAKNKLTNTNKEFKISIKQSDADFLENKISLERALEILGCDAQNIIQKSIISVRQSFEDDYLVYFNKFKRTEAKCFKIGWKFEFINKSGGERSGEMKLTDSQKIDVYSGSNLNINKKNSLVNHNIRENSGIANYILEVENTTENLNYYLDKLIPIEQFAVKQDIYFACKAINYRAIPDKWDGNRPLSVYVKWTLNGSEIKAELIMNNPLAIKANEIGENIREILKELNIKTDNFDELKTYLSKDINIYF
ncbi:hypothetical protein [Tenacibaculum finnmarkense]|uniref:hypothetical protein n=1 Tax=Tenacibaculum finnmarkense TaxID=2781243 RepID=UPI001E32FF69|nr:hypothetical protein [Tenacibaculum finnmarkense]MCD8412169.1 hypothetical protein [Tenacibaculum finnmarkense genomovar ulcerans]MCG8205913.1 hypothetical protein [Tenacibaculum finnmarkense genomovar finnmarkense]MCG8722016.1 hypothetical protein [Tenacibaculum finnmarkense]MCG8740296.1 hypothetical protein [Tenacibaculum finnmarkense]MCG8763630.1 hypothetical protein [Tenacibaculum finnmarkense]